MPTAMGLIQGTLDMVVLKAVAFGPRHGYAVARWVAAATGGTLVVEDGALYTALHRLEKRGWLASEWGVTETNRRAKFYALTDAGRAQLRAEERTWAQYADAISRVLSATSDPA